MIPGACSGRCHWCIGLRSSGSTGTNVGLLLFFTIVVRGYQSKSLFPFSCLSDKQREKHARVSGMGTCQFYWDWLKRACAPSYKGLRQTQWAAGVVTVIFLNAPFDIKERLPFLTLAEIEGDHRQISPMIFDPSNDLLAQNL